MQNRINMSYILRKNCSSSKFYTMTVFFSSLFFFKVWVGPRFCVTLQSKTCEGHLIVELSRLHTLRHIHTYIVCTTPLKVLSARRSGCYTHNTLHHKEIVSIPSAGLEPAIPPIERLQTYALHSMFTRMDDQNFI